jgi:excisionase family DNA binding protein
MPKNTAKTILSIKDAAEYLGVSTKTLRRWEARGNFLPIRTAGGHRRYQIDQLKSFKRYKRKKQTRILKYIPQETASLPTTEVKQPTKIESVDSRVHVKLKDEDIKFTKQLPKLYKAIPKTQKNVLSLAFATFAVLLIITIVSNFQITKNFARSTKISEYIEPIQREVASIITGITSEQKAEELAKQEEIYAKVLAATSFENIKFTVNVESTFKKNATIDADLAVNGGDITSTSDTVNLINDTSSTLNIGGSASAINLGATTSTVAVADDLDVTGVAFIPTLTINEDTITDITGTGLQVTDAALETTLGTSIESAEITDGTIVEADLSVTNTPADNQILSYDSGTGTFTWVAEATGTSSLWTDSGTLTYLTATTDSITVGSSTELAKIAADGDADEVQLLVQGNSTQTSDLVVFEQSDGTDLFTLDNNGTISLTRASAGQWIAFNDGTDTWGLYNYAGSPEGVIAADIGTLAMDTGTGTLYVKTTDTVSTGWLNLATGGSAQWTLSGTTLHPNVAARDIAVGVASDTLTAPFL